MSDLKEKKIRELKLLPNPIADKKVRGGGSALGCGARCARFRPDLRWTPDVGIGGVCTSTHTDLHTTQ